MTKQEQLEFLDQLAERLNQFPIEERHVILCALLAWHVKAAPPRMMKKALQWTVNDAWALIKKAKGLNIHAPSDLRH